MDIKRKVSSENGPAANFTGAVHIDRPIAPEPAAGADWRVVTFQPALGLLGIPIQRARFLSSPPDRVAFRGRADRSRRIRPGDVVLISADEKHWHGASPTAAMTHVAINEAPTNWMDKVTDEQYEAKRCA